MGESKQKKNKGAAPVAAPQAKSAPQRSGMVKTVKEMTYGKNQFKWMLIGVGLIALGMILMSGGWMPSPDVWDESIIYSSRRLVLAPICILAGLALQIYAIFKVD
ncbi:MAG TPA: DUF3098 domain-containing protein [Saprospiraceae bacterium]|nr:DUF3098 domain-containing protein [Saprospiraceae bacterium]